MKNITPILLLLCAFMACSHDDEREDYPTRSVTPADSTANDSGFIFRADTAWKDTIRVKF